MFNILKNLFVSKEQQLKKEFYEKIADNGYCLYYEVVQNKTHETTVNFLLKEGNEYKNVNSLLSANFRLFSFPLVFDYSNMSIRLFEYDIVKLYKDLMRIFHKPVCLEKIVSL